MARRICVFTGSRAEYGLLEPLMREIQADSQLELQLIVSGSHLARDLGETWRQIDADGFRIDGKVDMQLDSDAPVALAQSMARCLSGCAEVLSRLSPDIFVVLGDRYEVLAAAEASMMLGIPIAHIHGGEITEGAMDDAIRHAVTKLAHLHFAATEEYRQRIIRLGENPDRVFATGAPGLDVIAKIKLMSREELEKDLGFRFADKNMLVTFHPETLGSEAPSEAVRRLFAALDRFPETGVIITKSNADAGGREINKMIDHYAGANARRVVAASSLGQRRYLSVMAQVDAVVGNSSSGIIEAPAMGKPTVNIGDRQRGRTRAPSIIDCEGSDADVAEAIGRALGPEMQQIASRRQTQYGAGGASAKIKTKLAAAKLEGILRKPFYSAA